MRSSFQTSGPSNTRPDVFISDLHLCASRPHITAALLHFLKHLAGQAHALYILGDLFEYWAGDEEIDNSHHQPIIAAFRALAASGVQLYFMHGNRDFLIASRFCSAASMQLLPDPSLINVHGKRVLLSHGDDLCTDDVSYQAFRRQVREPQWQANFLSQPLAERKQQIEAIRLRSEQEKSEKQAQIMDVNPDAVAALLSAYDYPELFIHGHTHRPDQHLLQLNGHNISRWVLGDWYEQGSYLVCDQHDCKAASLDDLIGAED
jgi:UDP-2,3-diacylglucosamine hydrolase